jgi:hypothetical protein
MEAKQLLPASPQGELNPEVNDLAVSMQLTA